MGAFGQVPLALGSELASLEPMVIDYNLLSKAIATDLRAFAGILHEQVAKRFGATGKDEQLDMSVLVKSIGIRLQPGYLGLFRAH